MKPPARRRSKRKKTGAEKRVGRFAGRCEPAELASWIQEYKRRGYLGLSDWIRDRCNSGVRLGVQTSSDDDTWNSPHVVFAVLERMGPIALDPCSNATSIVPALRKIVLPENGLLAEWPRCAEGLGYVYVNPPFGDDMPAWIWRMIQAAHRGSEIVTLVPARVDTQWWDDLQTTADVALWRGRMTFLDAPSTAPFPVALAYWGPRRELFRSCVEEVTSRLLDAMRPCYGDQDRDVEIGELRSKVARAARTARSTVADLASEARAIDAAALERERQAEPNSQLVEDDNSLISEDQARSLRERNSGLTHLLMEWTRDHGGKNAAATVWPDDPDGTKVVYLRARQRDAVGRGATYGEAFEAARASYADPSRASKVARAARSSGSRAQRSL